MMTRASYSAFLVENVEKEGTLSRWRGIAVVIDKREQFFELSTDHYCYTACGLRKRD
jgi:hypothetical protein